MVYRQWYFFRSAPGATAPSPEPCKVLFSAGEPSHSPAYRPSSQREQAPREDYGTGLAALQGSAFGYRAVLTSSAESNSRQCVSPPPWEASSPRCSAWRASSPAQRGSRNRATSPGLNRLNVVPSPLLRFAQPSPRGSLSPSLQITVAVNPAQCPGRARAWCVSALNVLRCRASYPRIVLPWISFYLGLASLD